MHREVPSNRAHTVGLAMMDFICKNCLDLLDRKEGTNLMQMLKYNGGFARLTWKGVMCLGQAKSQTFLHST